MRRGGYYKSSVSSGPSNPHVTLPSLSNGTWEVQWDPGDGSSTYLTKDGSDNITDVYDFEAETPDQDLEQVTAGNQPLYVESVSSANNRNAFRFTRSSSDHVEDLTPTGLVRTDTRFVLAFCFALGSSSSGENHTVCALSAGDISHCYTFRVTNTSGNFVITGVNTASGAWGSNKAEPGVAIDSDPHVVIVEYLGSSPTSTSSWNFWFDGVAQTIAAGGAASPGTNHCTIGSNPFGAGGNHNFDGDIFDVSLATMTGALSGADRSSIQSAFDTHFGL